jgi:hypothetical protein
MGRILKGMGQMRVVCVQSEAAPLERGARGGNMKQTRIFPAALPLHPLDLQAIETPELWNVELSCSSRRQRSKQKRKV